MALFMASPASSAPTSAAKPVGGGPAAGGHLRGQVVDLGAGGVAGGGQRLQRLVGDVELGQPAAASSAQASTPASPSPGPAYLRTSAVIAARRSSTSASRPGSASRSAT